MVRRGAHPTFLQSARINGEQRRANGPVRRDRMRPPRSSRSTSASLAFSATCRHRAARIALGMAAMNPLLAQPTITNLGVLPGGTNSYGLAISADGSTVVGESESSAGVRAFRWTAQHGMQDLGTLPGGNYS